MVDGSRSKLDITMIDPSQTMISTVHKRLASNSWHKHNIRVINADAVDTRLCRALFRQISLKIGPFIFSN